ncbi:MAG TPA: ABC transporter permease [Candidatus Krumholzibacteria bacterium]|nr:ABC transporter permease [Candidatus Krumholzibacteria bacterium]
MRPSFRVVLEGVRIAYTALLANKLRTLLTLLGNIVGIMSVIAVVSLLGGIDLYMRNEVAAEGSNLFSIQRVNFLEAIEDFETFIDKVMYNPQLTRDDANALRESLELAKYVSARSESGGVNVSALGKSVEVTVAGCDAVYPFISEIPLTAGRHLTQIDDRENAQVAVLGWDVYSGLIAPRDAVGMTVRIGNRHFRVIGVAAQCGRILGQSRDRFVIVPLGAYRKVFGPQQSVEIRIVAEDIRLLEDAMEEATVAMRIRHGLGPRDENDFAVTSSEQLINLWKSISRGVMTALVALVGVSMLVGGIVLMNTMVVSVTERTREVGLRKAVGAPQGAIMWQFLVESATLSVFGGIAGMALGFAIAAIVSAVSVLPYVVNAALVGIAFAVTIAVGLVFGTYPALRAARLDPVDALRSE